MNKKQNLFQRVKRVELISKELVESLLAGDYRSVFRGPGIEFDEVRDYVEGDDARLIDWNVSSRMGSAYTKTFREERELQLFILVDMSASILHGEGGTGWNRRESLAQLFALLAFAAIRNNDRVGALFFTDRNEHWVPPRKGRKHGLRLIQEMLAFEPRGKGSELGGALRGAGEALKRRGICVILSDFKTSGYLKELRIVARKHDTIAIRIVSPLDLEFPQTGLIELEDPETGSQILARGLSPAYRKQYKDYWGYERRTWRRECTRRGVSTLEVRTDEDPAARLVQYFRRRRKSRRR